MNLLPRLCCRFEGFVPWVPEAFLARFPVASYVPARCVGLRPTRLGLRPIWSDASEKKPLVPRVKDLHTERQEDNMNLPRS